MLERARERAADVTFAGGELTALPFPAVEADLVVTGLALTHIADLTPVYAEFARVLKPGGDLVVSDVHEGLVFLGSVVKASGPDGRPQLAATNRHSTADHLARRTGGWVHRPQLSGDTSTDHADRATAEPTREIGDWRLWPWTLMGFDPAATRASWHTPAIAVWHFRRAG